ncbi:MAG: dodecin domain-containing protein [Desulforudis sp.]|jgi:flavin-binding protein dodecin|nr:dodecin family protein [Clostridia bacterium]MDQ7791735.1 dodecin family protein [Clostridia bacterium]RJX22896.1 MAG: dodecin domain-containing protein [Desulforudis sp.]
MQIKVEEFIGESNQSWQDAVTAAVSEASKTLGNVTGVEVVNFTARVENGKVVGYKADCKVAAVK